MSEIIYEEDADEILYERTKLDGRNGGISLYLGDDYHEIGEEFLIFENTDALMAFVERLTEIVEATLEQDNRKFLGREE